MPHSHDGPADRRVQTVCLLILTLIATAVALALLQPVLVPFVLAIFFTQCLTPFVDMLMKRFGWPQTVAVTVAAVGGAAVVAGLVFCWPLRFRVCPRRKISRNTPSRFQSMTDNLLQSRGAHWLGLKQGATSDSVLSIIKDKGVDLFAFVATLMGTIVKNTATVLILMAFLLFGRHQAARDGHGILREIEIRVQRYISLTVGISILTGVLVGASLSIVACSLPRGLASSRFC